VGAASSFAKGKGNGYLTSNSRHFGESVVVEIGVLNYAGEHPSVAPESTVVDALADVLLRVGSPKTD